MRNKKLFLLLHLQIYSALFLQLQPLTQPGFFSHKFISYSFMPKLVDLQVASIDS